MMTELEDQELDQFQNLDENKSRHKPHLDTSSDDSPNNQSPKTLKAGIYTKNQIWDDTDMF